MTDKVKKLVLLNLPYLIFVYLFDKLCQGVRLAPGADASEKLLHIGQGFSAAFDSLAPSFHLVDLCVGAAGAVLIRLVVYSKGKNAKKYRRGIEYGSARWVRERPLGHPGRHCSLHGQGLFPKRPAHPDGADHHVEPPQGAQVRKK